MSRAPQDEVYLATEADAFFERNSAEDDPRALRPRKRGIARTLERSGVRPRRVLEYGCHHGDLLGDLAGRGAECHGVEPSARAVARGREAFGDAVRLVQGTMAENEVNADPRFRGYFDLVIVDDVLCWVSRETLFRSLANLDEVLADGGHLFLREFLPDRNRRNQNHHVEDAEVWCYKPAGPHRAAFLAGGTYAVVHEEVWIDRDDAYAQRSGRPLEARWIDSLLAKSLGRWFE